MSKTIDKNIVELEFDNSKFEGNVKQSMSTLDKLKSKLKFDGATKGLDEIEKASKKLDFSHMESEIDKLNDHWGIKTYAMQQLIWTLTQDAINAGKKIASALTIDQVSAGWSKMDQMTGSVQTLVNSTGKTVDEINGYLSKLMWYSDETSFGFTDMTSALATMTSAGGDIDKLIPMIEGIANATAYAGKGAAEFSRVIYNLNQSYSGGALTLMDWKSVQLAGVNSKALMQTLIKTGEELGKIKKGTVDVSNFTETLKNKWADTEVMEKAFGKFSSMTEEAYKLVDAGVYDTASEAYEALSGQFDEIAERAAKSAQEAKTFKEAIDSVKDAVSSKWLNIFTVMFGDYEQQKETWTNLANDLWELFAAPLDDLSDTLGRAFNSKWTNFSDTLSGLGVNVDDLDSKFIKFVKDTQKNTPYKQYEDWSKYVDSLIIEYGSLDKALASGKIDASKYAKGFIELLDSESKSVGTLEDKLTHLQGIFDDIWIGKYGSGDNRIKALTEAGIDYATAQGLINKMAQEGHRAGYKLLAEDIAYLSDEQLISLGLTAQQSEELKTLSERAKEAGVPLEDLIKSMGKKSGQELLSDTISNLVNIILNLKNTVGEAWSKVFDSRSISNKIYDIVDSVEKFTRKIRDLTENSSLLKDIFVTIFSVFKTVNSVISQLVRGGLSIIQKILSSLNISVGDLSSKLSDSAKDFADWITQSDSIYNILDSAGDKISGIIKAISEWIDSIKKIEFVQKIIKGATDAFDGLKKGISGIDFNNISFDGFLDSLKNFGSSLKDTNLDFGKSFSNSIGVYFSNVGADLSNIKDKFKDTFGKLENYFSNLGENVEKVYPIIKSFMETLVGIGAGVGTYLIISKLADAFTILVSPLKTLKDIGNGFAGMTKSIGGFFDAMKNNIKTNNIIKLAAVLGLLVLGLWGLAKLDSKALWNAVGAVAALSLVLVGLSFALSKMPTIKKGTLEVGKVILTLAASVLILAIAIKMLSELDSDRAVAAAFSIGIVVVALGLALKEIGKNDKYTKQSGKTLLALSASILIISFAMKSLAELEWNDIGKSIVGLVAAIGGLTLVVWAMSKIPESSKAGLQILALSVSLLLICKAIKDLAAIPGDVYLKGILALIPIFTGYVALSLILKSAGSQTAGTAAFVLAIGASLGLIASTMKKFAKMSAGDIIKGGAVALILIFALSKIATSIGEASTQFGGFKQLAGISLVILTLSASLFIIAGAVLIFKNMDTEGLIKGMGAVVVAMLTIAGSIRIMAKSLNSQNTNAFKIITSFVVAIVAVTAAIWVLSNIPIKNLIAATTGMTAVLLSLSLMMAIISNGSTNFGKTMGNVLAIGLILAEIGAIFWFVNTQIPVSTVLPIAEGLTKVILALSAAMVALGVAGVLADLAGPGLFIIEGALVVLEGIIAGTVYLASLADPEAIDKAAIVLEKIGKALGGFFSGFMVGSTAGLPEVGTNLTDFMTNLSGFLEALSDDKFPSNIKDKVESIIDIITTFGGRGLQRSIKSLASNKESFTDLQTVLDGYAEAIVSFSSKLSEGKISSYAVRAAADAGMMMTNLMDALPTKGGFFSLFTGEKQTLKSFGVDMGVFAAGLVTVSKKIGSDEFDSTAIEKAKDAGEMMANLANSLPSRGVLHDAIVGGKDLGDFGPQMQPFAQGLIDVCTLISDPENNFSQDTIDKAKAAGDTMVALTESIPNSWNVKDFLFGGNKDLSSFGSDISAFATGLVEMCTTLSSCDSFTEYTVAKAKTAGTLLSELASNLPDANSLKSSILGGGKQSLSDLGSEASMFAYDLSLFCSEISQITEIPDDNKITSLQKVIDFLTNLSNNTGLTSNNAKDKSLAISEYADGFSKILSSLAELSNSELGSLDITNILLQISNIIANIASACLTSAETNTNITLISYTTWMKEKLDNMGKDLGNEGRSKLKEAGQETLKGLYYGLTDLELINKIREAGENAAEEFNQSYRNHLAIHSPSKVMQENGHYTIDGLINGIKDRFSSIRKAGSYVGETLNEALGNAINLASATVESGLNPVITPVLDLSEIQNGTNGLNGMLSNIPLNTNLAPIGYNNPQLNNSPVNININFDINNAGKDITEIDINKWTKQITKQINRDLGFMTS